MGFQQRSLLTDEEYEVFCNLINLCPKNTQVLAKVKLSEFLTPDAEYGTDEFFQAFITLSKVTAPFILYDLKTNNVIAVIEFFEDAKPPSLEIAKDWLKSSGIELLVIKDLVTLYTDNRVQELLIVK